MAEFTNTSKFYERHCQKGEGPLVKKIQQRGRKLKAHKKPKFPSVRLDRASRFPPFTVDFNTASFPFLAEADESRKYAVLRLRGLPTTLPRSRGSRQAIRKTGTITLNSEHGNSAKLTGSAQENLCSCAIDWHLQTVRLK